jgi:RNA polymerase sigma-70 factor (ECF subfamily)
VGAGGRRPDQAFGDLDVAEDAAAEAFATAVERWPAIELAANTAETAYLTRRRDQLQ